MAASSAPGRALALFTLEAGRPLGEAVAARLGVALARHEEREFEYGQHKTRPLESVRERDVYVLQSLHGDREASANDRLVRLLFFLGALRDAGAARVTAVAPFLCYARKDRKTKPRDPVTTRYVAGLFEAMDVDRVVALDVHNLAAFQNAFRCRTEHLEARGLLVRHLAPRLRGERVAVVSPDVGGVKRAERFREALAEALGAEPAAAFVEKRRSEGVVSGEAVVGAVEGRTCLLVDDMAAGGTTLARAARACRAQGAVRVLAAVTHGVFTPEADSALVEPALERVAVLDHVPLFALPRATAEERLERVSSAGLFAEAIRRLHEGGSLVDLDLEPAVAAAAPREQSDAGIASESLS